MEDYHRRGTVILVFGVLVVVIANQFMGRALRSENDRARRGDSDESQ
jgi:hypothetical protein